MNSYLPRVSNLDRSTALDLASYRSFRLQKSGLQFELSDFCSGLLENKRTIGKPNPRLRRRRKSWRRYHPRVSRLLRKQIPDSNCERTPVITDASISIGGGSAWKSYFSLRFQPARSSIAGSNGGPRWSSIRGNSGGGSNCWPAHA
jgi:hypothetical protein